MGIYAQTDIQIECTNNLVARKVEKVIKEKAKKEKDDFNYQFEHLGVGDDTVCLFKSSPRVQNLEYQCEELWKLIKNIKGVLEMNCPFLMEGDGAYYSNYKD